MVLILGILNSVLLGIISGFHFYWASGGKLGGDIVLPEVKSGTKAFKPGSVSTFVVALVFLFFGFLSLNATELVQVELPVLIQDYGVIVLGGIFSLRAVGEFKYIGFFKTIKETKFGYYDTRYFSPLSLLMAVNFFVIHFFKI